MAELINLNKARKAKAKQSRTEKAVQNRVTFGLSTKLRQAAKAEQKRQAAVLDAQQRTGAEGKLPPQADKANSNT